MDKEAKMALIQRKTRQRLGFSLVTLVLYFSYILNYTGSSSLLADKVGNSQVTGSLLLFVSLIVVFIGLEILFLAVNRDDGQE